MNRSLDPSLLSAFWNGYAPKYEVGILYTANHIRRVSEAVEAYRKDYNHAVREWRSMRSKWGAEFDDTRSAFNFAFQARIEWQTRKAWLSGAPRGAKYCNLSPSAQKKMSR